MTLGLRMILGFTIILAGFIAMVGATMFALASFQADDRILATDIAAFAVLRDSEGALLREEAALDGHIVRSDAALKAEFEGPARATTDASLAAAMAVLSGYHRLDELRDRVIEWRGKTETDVLALARQPSTQAAKGTVHQTLAAVVQAMQQEIAATQTRKEEMAHRLVMIMWGATTAAFGVAFAAAWWLTRSIQRPIVVLTASVDAIATGDLDTVVNNAERRNEIGWLARSMEIFRAGAIENRRLQHEQETRKQQVSAERIEVLRGIADALERRIAGLMATLADLGGTLDTSSSTMSEVAERTADRSNAATTAAEQTQTNHIALNATIEAAKAVEAGKRFVDDGLGRLSCAGRLRY